MLTAGNCHELVCSDSFEQDLIWSGACAFQNRVACDFRAFTANGTTFISTILTANNKDGKGRGIVLDSAYETVQQLEVLPGMSSLNMHELTYVNDGSRALYIVNRPLYVGLATVLLDAGASTDSGWILDLGIREVDLASGETTFMWWASDHITLTEVISNKPANYNNMGTGWDWLYVLEDLSMLVTLLILLI